MPVIKNKSTAENREFWSHVEAIAQAVRSRNAHRGTVATAASANSGVNARNGEARPERCAPATVPTERH
jgi:hypothetical protein